MKRKIFLIIIGGCILPVISFSQTLKENIDKAAKDKATMDKSAKADVLIQKKIIADSTVQYQHEVLFPGDKTIPSRKKPHHKKQKKKL